ncbi:MAG: PAS domain S-box protein [Desulfovibrionales bacterium]|nr:PAS domain S-box protein [Desulfovibrionales bacterium]
MAQKTAALEYMIKKASEELSSDHEHAQGIFDVSLDALVSLSEEGIIAEANEEMARLTGYSREELMGSPFQKYFTSFDEATNMFRRILKEGSATGCELVLRSKKGEKAVVSCSGSIYKSGENKGNRIFAVLRNITRRTRITREVQSYITRLERMVQEADERYARIFNTSNDILYSTSKDGKLIDINPAGVNLLGFDSKEELLAINTVQSLYLNPGDRQKFQEKIEKDGFVKDYPITFKRKDGHIIHVLVNAYARTDEQENVLGYEGIIRDVTETRRQEEQLESFINAVRCCRDAIIATDLNFIITSWNKGAEEVYGYTEEEAVGNGMEIIVPESRLGECKRLLKKVFTGAVVDQYETIRQTKHGETIYVDMKVTPLKNRDGEIVGIFSVARPI